MLKLNLGVMEGAYIMLKAGPVFNRLRIAHPSLVKFGVLTGERFAGDYQWIADDKHIIRLAQPYCSTLEHAVETMAHEMIHMHQHIARTVTPRVVHNAEFKRISKRVCDAYGFPFPRFV